MTKLSVLLRHWKLSRKLLVSYILLATLPLLLMFLVSYSSYTRIIRSTSSENAEIIIDRVREEVDSLLQDALDFVDGISNNAIIQDAVRGNFNPEDKQFQLNTIAGRELLGIFDYRDEIYGIAVIGENGQSLITTSGPTRREDLRTKYWYRKALQSSFPPVHYPPHIGSFVFYNDETSFFSIATPILDRDSNARIGVVIIDIEEDVFRNMMNYRLGTTGYLFIQYDRSGFTTNRSQAPDSEYLIRLAKNQEIGQEILKQKKELVLIRNLSIPEMRLAAVVSLKELAKDGQRITLALIMLVAVILFLAVFLASSLTQSISSPVNELRACMTQVENGNLNIRVPTPFHDELGELGSNFNHMVERIETLVDNVREDQILLRKTEFRALQAQINPHFLYNTLDSINWLTREGRSDDVIKLVGALTALFRIGLSRGKDIITVEEELNHVRSYLTIQKIRYDDLFTYTLDIDAEIGKRFVPKIILQPLVENAIYHGIKQRKNRGMIDIRARQTRNYGIVEVTDNGPGMSPERLDEVLHEIQSGRAGREPTVYGLKNVNDRLKIYFGEDAGLIIHSTPDSGTCVTMRIPLKEGLNA